jgi:uncharacterized protein DUF3147
MSQLLLLAAKALLAGVFVALISQLSTALKPKMFAGLFAAAPSVAAASLLLNGLQKPRSIAPSGEGMIAGSIGMIACCVAAMFVVPKLRALLASAAGWVAWGAAAAAAYVGLWR